MSDDREDFQFERGAKGTGGELWLDERGKRQPWIWIAALVGVLAIAGGLWIYLRRGAEETAPGPPPAASEPAQAEVPGGVPEEVAVPPLAETDPWLRQVIAQLSGHPALAEWLATDDLVRRFVVLVDNVAAGQSPSQHVPFVRSQEAFAVRRSGDGTYISPSSFERYATLAAVVDSLHVEGTADLYRRLEPRFEEAYRELGYPDSSFEEALERAIDRVLAAPTLDGPVALEEGATSYQYADPRLEALDGATKDLLRLGPDHLATIQRKVRALSGAAGLGVGGS
jgi:hypothetical protein